MAVLDFAADRLAEIAALIAQPLNVALAKAIMNGMAGDPVLEAAR